MKRISIIAASITVIGLASAASALAQSLQPTPRDMRGPYYPDRLPADRDADLTQIAGHARSAQGQVLALGGRVLDRNGQALAGVRIEIWQTDANGRYVFETIRPGYYWDTFGSNIYRCTHIHAKVFVNDRLSVVTQVYFPDDPFNARDPLYAQCSSRGDCMLDLNAAGTAGTFNFKVNA